MSRHRSTRHCRECAEHLQKEHWPHTHYCAAARYLRIPYDPSRTSPDWCPKGHMIPGEFYPTFSPGKDPWIKG